ncbi:MAG: sulfite exporter TauE/SafE family protein [Candidatus Bathyarchaeia archaeon]
MFPFFLLIPILLFVGFASSFVAGSLGMGYGVISASILVSIGFNPATASASIHAAELINYFFLSASHLKLGNVKNEITSSLALFGVLGGVTGAYLVTRVSAGPFSLAVNVFLLVLGALMLLRFIKGFSIFEKEDISPFNLKILGFSAGFVDAFAGGGWGPIVTSTLFLHNCEARKAIGTSIFTQLFVTSAITAAFLIFPGNEIIFDFKIIASLSIGTLISLPAITFFCKKLPSKILGIIIGIVIIALNMLAFSKLL